MGLGIDVIGDVHGCREELETLIAELGYRRRLGRWHAPQGRRLAFLGDLVDRGPDNVGTLLLVDELVSHGCALIGAIGNHDWRLYQALILGLEPVRKGGLPETLTEIEQAEHFTPGTKSRLLAAIERLFGSAPAYSVLANGQLVLTHGAVEPATLGEAASARRNDEVSGLCMSGETDGQIDAKGRPVRTFGWVDLWVDSKSMVCFGHNVCGDLPRLYGEGRVVALDTGCVFGGTLTAFRFPERDFVSVQAVRRHSFDVPVPVSADLLGTIPAVRLVTPAHATPALGQLQSPLTAPASA